jgi:hypothetical protein
MAPLRPKRFRMSPTFNAILGVTTRRETVSDSMSDSDADGKIAQEAINCGVAG